MWLSRGVAPVLALCIAGCGGAHPMQRVASFELRSHEVPVCDGPALAPELLSISCVGGEEPWEERYQNGSFVRECRGASGEATARLAISLSTTRCLEALDRWRIEDGTMVRDVVGSWSRERAHVELRSPCDDPRECRRGRFALSVVGGNALEGGFDDQGRPHGRWTVDARASGGTVHVVELEHGDARITGLLEVERLECRGGLVHGELVASRQQASETMRRELVYEDGLPHGAFRLVRGAGADTVVLAGGYEHGAPRGAWTLPTRTCAHTEVVGCLEECVVWTPGSIAATCDGGCQAPPLPEGTAIALEPGVHDEALRCDDVIVATAGLALRLAGAGWLAEVRDHDLLRDLGGPQ